MKNPLYTLDHLSLLNALKSPEVSLAFSQGDYTTVIDNINEHSLSVGESITLNLKVKNRRIKGTTKNLEALVRASGSTVQELKYLHEKFKEFLNKYFSIPTQAIKNIDFNPEKYELNKSKINCLIRFNAKLNDSYSEIQDKLTKQEFISLFFRFAQPFVMGVDKKLSPDVVTEETVRQTHALIVLYVSHLEDPYRDLTVYLIQKFVGYTKYDQSRIDTYINNPTSYLKFRAGIQVLLDHVTDIKTNKPFGTLSNKLQYAYIELWIKYNLEVYLTYNGSKSFSVLDEAAQIGFIAGRNPNSRENALLRYKVAEGKLKKGMKIEEAKPTNSIKLSKKLQDW